jgi:hypothetical protein
MTGGTVMVGTTAAVEVLVLLMAAIIVMVLLMGTLLAVSIMAATDGRRYADDVTGRAANGAVNVVVIVVALIAPVMSISYSAPNPTVGIGAPRITLGSACVPFRLRYPPIPLLRGNGLIAGKGTPRITIQRTERVSSVDDDGSLLLILMPRLPLLPARVVSGHVSRSMSSTRSGPALSVTTTNEWGPGRRVGEGGWSTVRRRLTDRPHDTPVMVGVGVTATVADVDANLTMDELGLTV